LVVERVDAVSGGTKTLAAGVAADLGAGPVADVVKTILKLLASTHLKNEKQQAHHNAMTAARQFGCKNGCQFG
jgi:hypothetical protein